MASLRKQLKQLQDDARVAVLIYFDCDSSTSIVWVDELLSPTSDNLQAGSQCIIRYRGKKYSGIALATGTRKSVEAIEEKFIDGGYSSYESFCNNQAENFDLNETRKRSRGKENAQPIPNLKVKKPKTGIAKAEKQSIKNTKAKTTKKTSVKPTKSTKEKKFASILVVMNHNQSPAITSETPTQLPSTSETPTQLPVTSETPTQLPFTSETPTQLPVTSETQTQLPSTSETPTQLPVTSETPTQLPFTSETPTQLPSTSETPTQLPPTCTPMPETPDFHFDFFQDNDVPELPLPLTFPCNALTRRVSDLEKGLQLLTNQMATSLQRIETLFVSAIAKQPNPYLSPSYQLDQTEQHIPFSYSTTQPNICTSIDLQTANHTYPGDENESHAYPKTPVSDKATQLILSTSADPTENHTYPQTPTLPKTTVLPIPKDILQTPTSVLARYPKLRGVTKAGKLAVKLGREAFFGETIMKRCTVYGCRGLPPLPKKELHALKDTMIAVFAGSHSPAEFEQIWKQCEAALGQACNALRNKLAQKFIVLDK